MPLRCLELGAPSSRICTGHEVSLVPSAPLARSGCLTLELCPSQSQDSSLVQRSVTRSVKQVFPDV